jgi:regulator of telomere elongation helicase 1
MRAVKRHDRPANEASSLAALNPKARQQPRVVNPISPPTTIELRGVPIHFPFKPYKCQEDYMGKVLDALIRSENALLESPTGTGKTLCLLCATLAWQREQARQISNDIPPGMAVPSSQPTTKKPSNRPPTIIYASRTHSQLSQVVRELRNTRYRPKHAVLGSRDQMCVNPKVKKAKATSSEINHDCSKMGKERKCHFKNKVEGFRAPSNESGAFGDQPVMDMEDLVSMGKTYKVCPFYYTRSLVEDAELVLVPYNYLFDKEARSSTLAGVPWDNAIVIFDEAHNLESFASESASFDLTSTDIAGCVGEVQRALGYIQAMPGLGEGVKQDNLIRIKSIFLNLEEYILRLGNKSAYLGEFMMEIFEKGASITHANHELFINEVRKLTDIFMDVQGGSNARGAPRLEHFVQCVKRVFGESTEARCLAKAKSYRVHVTPKATGSGRIVSFWCFAPAEAMRELANLNVRSILVTSGTLSPLDSYAMELDLPFPHRLENPHIIPEDQIHVRVVAKGVSGKQLCSSYERRQDSEYFIELGNTLVSFGRVVPGGMLVFFPSYGVMETCLERWGGPTCFRPSMGKGKPSSFFAAKRRKSTTGTSRFSFPYTLPGTFSASKEATTPWTRLLACKAVVVEPRATSDLPDAIAEFHKHLNLPKSTGCVLFGVCRGKISEGIDFANDMCRAVIITGLPFAPSFDAKVKMKREFLDGNRASQKVKATGDGGFGDKPTSIVSLSGHEWYTQQAHRAVNQVFTPPQIHTLLGKVLQKVGTEGDTERFIGKAIKHIIFMLDVSLESWWEEIGGSLSMPETAFYRLSRIWSVLGIVSSSQQYVPFD